jgi:hypothetical protein
MIIAILISFIFGFGFWYMIFWFLTNEPNLFLWHFVTKLSYILLSFLAIGGILTNLTDNSK